jgi:fermentation-respiration switch protein FrsA (DUF1100 family)
LSRRRLGLILGSALAFAGIVALPGVASAAPGRAIRPHGASACPTNDFCFWSGYNETGAMYALAGGAAIYSLVPKHNSSCGGDTWNDCARSAYDNNPGDDAMLWVNIAFSGSCDTLTQKDGPMNLAVPQTIPANSLSSVDWMSDVTKPGLPGCAV